MAALAAGGRSLERYIRFIIRRRYLVLGIFLAITLLSAWKLRHFQLASNLELLLGENPHFDQYQERIKQFASDGLTVIGFPNQDLLAPSTLDRLERVVQELEDEKYTKRVLSVFSAQRVLGSDDALTIESYADLARENPERRSEYLKEMTRDPMIGDLLISKDGLHSIVMLEGKPITIPAESSMETMEYVMAAFEKEGFDPAELYRTGNVAILAENLTQSIYNLTRITPVVVVILVLAIFIMFRKFWPVALTLLVTFMAIVWTLGVAIELYGGLNFFTTMIPPLILITTFADVVHLCSAYLLELSAAEDKEEAIMKCGVEVGTACGYTSLTTLVGFLSMAMVPTPIFRQSGLLLGFGVSVALFMAMTLVPIFLYIFPAPKPWRMLKEDERTGLMAKYLSANARFTQRRPWAVNLFFIGFLCFSLVGVSRIKFETSFTERMSENNIIQIGARYFSEHFGGLHTADLYIETEEEGGLLDPVLFARIASAQDEIKKMPGIAGAISPVDLARKMNYALNPESGDPDALPTTREGLAQLFLLFDISGGEDLDAMLDFDRKTMAMRLRLDDDRIRKAYEVGALASDYAKARIGDGAVVEPLGYLYLLGEWLGDVLDGQRKGLIFAILTITLMMTVVVRSVRMGLVSMLPNLLPLLAIGGYAGWMWDTLDSDTLIAGLVAIGIGVDDTIHFMTRLRLESAKTDDVDLALERTFHFAGRAIMITSIILVCGFLPFATSDHLTIGILGTMLPMSLVMALAADLYWVPALVKLGALRFPKKGEQMG